MSVRKRTWQSGGETREAWIVDYTDQAGQRHIETFQKKKEADARHDEVRQNVRKGVHVAPSKSITVAEAGKRWADEAEAGGLERATVKTYREHVNLHIVPFLGRHKLSEITVPVVSQFKKDLRTKGRKPAMIRKIVVSLGSIIADAQESGLAAHNAVRELRRNKKRGDRKARAEKRKLEVGVDIPTPDEIRAILHGAPQRWRTFLVVAAFTGLRASELRGLRWRDVNLSDGELHVRQRADRYNEMGAPKSEAGERTVPFGKIVANALKESKLARGYTKGHEKMDARYQRAMKRGFCNTTSETLAHMGKVQPGADTGTLVFATSSGQPLEHSNLLKASLHKAQIAAKIVDQDGQPKYTGLHSLRHFYASWCINRVKDGGLGLPPKNVQARLGHSSITITLDTYGHLFKGDDTEELDAAEEALMRIV